MRSIFQSSPLLSSSLPPTRSSCPLAPRKPKIDAPHSPQASGEYLVHPIEPSCRKSKFSPIYSFSATVEEINKLLFSRVFLLLVFGMELGDMMVQPHDVILLGNFIFLN
jgi:hypothetical protein